jgi:hypothetical protein
MTAEAEHPIPDGPGLNEFQARRLRVTCQYVDRLLGEIEEILNIAASKAAFPRYAADVSPARQQMIEGCIPQIRAQLIRVVEEQGIPHEPPILASRAIQAAISAIDIAVEELKPRYMRGYGELPESAAAKLSDIAGSLERLVSQLAENSPAG